MRKCGGAAADRSWSASAFCRYKRTSIKYIGEEAMLVPTTTSELSSIAQLTRSWANISPNAPLEQFGGHVVGRVGARVGGCGGAVERGGGSTAHDVYARIRSKKRCWFQPPLRSCQTGTVYLTRSSLATLAKRLRSRKKQVIQAEAGWLRWVRGRGGGF